MKQRQRRLGFTRVTAEMRRRHCGWITRECLTGLAVRLQSATWTRPLPGGIAGGGFIRIARPRQYVVSGG